MAIKENKPKKCCIAVDMDDRRKMTIQTGLTGLNGPMPTNKRLIKRKRS